MGLEEHLKVGAQLTRDTITFTSPNGSGSVDLGSVFSILEIQTDTPVRLRLYDRQVSRDNVTEIARPFGTGAPTNVALVGDFSMSAAGTYNIAPAIFGFSQNRDFPQTFYRMENGSGTPIQATIRLKRFLLEDKSISIDPESAYAIDNRRTITLVSGSNIPSGGIVSGSLIGVDIRGIDIPQTYVMVSASVTTPGHKVRLRLYATSSAIYDEVEKVRPFSVEASSSVELLVDTLIQSGSEVIFFTPKLFGANLETMGNNLEETQLSLIKINGKNEIYYMLQNINSVTNDPEMKMAIYALED